MAVISFVYQDAKGIIKTWTLDVWRERGEYINSYDAENKHPLTFRIDRILQWVSGAELLENPHQEKGTSGKKDLKIAYKNKGPAIAFTGFNADEKESLYKVAEENRFHVVKDSRRTKQLSFLVCSDNPGQKAIEHAEALGAFVITKDEFFHLCETGEIPPDKLKQERSQSLLITFADGFSVDTFFSIREEHKPIFDIKLTPVIEAGQSTMKWTQGEKYLFNRGDVFYSDKLAYTDFNLAVKKNLNCIQVARIFSQSGAEILEQESETLNVSSVEISLFEPNPQTGKLELQYKKPVTPKSLVNFLIKGKW